MRNTSLSPHHHLLLWILIIFAASLINLLKRTEKPHVKLLFYLVESFFSPYSARGCSCLWHLVLCLVTQYEKFMLTMCWRFWVAFHHGFILILVVNYSNCVFQNILSHGNLFKINYTRKQPISKVRNIFGDWMPFASNKRVTISAFFHHE